MMNRPFNTYGGCPCLVIEACTENCSCAHPFLSGGCLRCAKYGSMPQRVAAATFIAAAVEKALIELHETPQADKKIDEAGEAPAGE